MSTVTHLTRSLGRLLVNNSPQIMTGIAVAGVVSSSVLAVKATPEAMALIDEARTEKWSGLQNEIPIEDIDFSVWETIKAGWQPYIPAVGVSAVTITCIIASQTISSKRQAALVGLFTVTDTAFREYRDKVTEVVGKTKEQQVRDKISEDHVRDNPVSTREVFLVGKGDQLCFDQLTGRYFESDMESLRRAENDINQKIINESYASQNDLYRLIGLPILDYGDEVGWTTDMMLNLDFTAVMSDDARPCIAIKYRYAPIRGYYNSFL